MLWYEMGLVSMVFIQRHGGIFLTQVIELPMIPSSSKKKGNIHLGILWEGKPRLLYSWMKKKKYH